MRTSKEQREAARRLCQWQLNRGRSGDDVSDVPIDVALSLLSDADALEAAEAVVRAASGFVQCECESCVEATLHHCGAFAGLCDALGDYHGGTSDDED